MCNSKSTHEYLHDLRQELSTHCRMTNKNLWIERVFQGRFLNKSFSGNKIKANLNVKKKEEEKNTCQKTDKYLGAQTVYCVAPMRTNRTD